MTQLNNTPNHDLALGQSIAALPEMQALREEASDRLSSGESRECVLAWLMESVRRDLGERSRLGGMDLSTAEWLLAWAETGEPGVLDTRLRGTVKTESLPDEEGGEYSVVWAMAGPTSDPEEIAEDFLTACRKTLPRECFKTKVNAERDARWHRLHKAGMSYREIAEQQLKEDGFDLRCASEEEWKQELDAWTSRITVACLRWQDHLTRLVDSV